MTTAELRNMIFSAHFINDRQTRKEQIDAIIHDNWGQVYKFTFQHNVWNVLTDTGMVFIVNAEKTKIITYYFATVRQAVGICRGSCPKAIIAKCRKNNKAYIELFNTPIKRHVSA